MKRKLLILTSFLLLTSCGAATSSVEPQKEYFDAFETAASKGLEEDNFGLRLDNGKAEMHLENRSTTEPTKEYGIKVDPAAFELRLGGLGATKADDLAFSLNGKTSRAKNGSKIFLTGEEIFNGAIVKNGLPLCVDAYLQKGTFYLDLYDSGVLRRGINEVIKSNIDADFPGFESRSHYDLTAENKTDIEGELPIRKRLLDAPKKLREEMDRIYASTPKEFAFQSSDAEKTIRFNATSWSSFRRIVEAYDLDEVTSSINVSSVMDEIEENATLDRFTIGLHYDASAWRSFDFDAAFTFKAKEGEGMVPVGTWTLSGSLAFFYGEEAKPIALTDKEMERYSAELVFPNFSKEE